MLTETQVRRICGDVFPIIVTLGCRAAPVIVHILVEQYVGHFPFISNRSKARNKAKVAEMVASVG